MPYERMPVDPFLVIFAITHKLIRFDPVVDIFLRMQVCRLKNVFCCNAVELFCCNFLVGATIIQRVDIDGRTEREGGFPVKFAVRRLRRARKSMR